MSKKITEIDEFQKYLKGVLNRANHHAQDVDKIILSLAGAIVWAKDSVPIEVLVQGGKTGNVLWIYIHNIKYAFSYNHESNEIEMRKDSTQGKTIFTFSNKTEVSDIVNFFNSLLS